MVEQLNRALEFKTHEKDEIFVKELTTLEEAEACEDLQVSIWPPHEQSAGFCIPIHLLISQMEIGGVVLGAYLDNKMVGFIFAVQAQDFQGTRFHYSCLAGVHKSYRHKGIMEKLKRRHAQIADWQAIDKIVWTYDPLQGPNANLNIKKLGGMVRKYKTNYYGVRAGGSPQNVGMPSDRFVLEWYLSKATKQDSSLKDIANLTELLNSETRPLANLVEYNEHNLPRIQQYNLHITTKQILVEIPSNFEIIRQHEKKDGLDIDWRLKTREIFSTYFDKNYKVINFLSLNENNNRRSFYLLEKDD